MLPTSCSDNSEFARLLLDSSYSSGYFRLSYSEISGCFCLLPDSLLFPSLPDVSVCLTFSDVPVLFSIRFTFHHFRMFRFSFSHLPGVVRLLPDSLRILYIILSCPDPFWSAARSLFDSGPLSIETEAQQYVLLGTTISAP